MHEYVALRTRSHGGWGSAAAVAWAAAAATPRESAALVMLARNSELEQARHTVESVERRFNRWFQYPVVFLNDEPFSEDFIQCVYRAPFYLALQLLSIYP